MVSGSAMIDPYTLTLAGQAASESAGCNAVGHKAFIGNEQRWIAVAHAVVRTLEGHGYAVEKPQDIDLDDDNRENPDDV